MSQDALELHIEDITGAEVKDVRYMNRKTEAIIKLNKTIKFNSEALCTISDTDVKIVSMHTKRIPEDKPTQMDKVNFPTQSTDLIPVPTRRPEDRSMEKGKVHVAIQCSEDLHKGKTDCAISPGAQAPPYPSPKESTEGTEGIKLSGALESVKEAKLKISEQVFYFDSHVISDV